MAVPLTSVVLPAAFPARDPFVYCDVGGPIQFHHWRLTGNGAEHFCPRCNRVLPGDQAIALLDQ